MNHVRNARNRFAAPYNLRALELMTEDERVDIVHKYHPALSRDAARDLLLSYEAERIVRQLKKEADAEAGAATRAQYDPKKGWPKTEAVEPKEPS